MKVLVTDNLSEKGVGVFRSTKGIEVDVRNKLSAEELLTCIPNYQGLVVRSATKVTAKVLDTAKNLKVVGRAGVGVDNIDVDAATLRGVVVMNTPGGNTITAAEHTISLMLSMAKNVPQATASMKQGKWEKSRFMNVEVYNKVLGIVGLGRIGSEVAKRAKGLAMRVIAYDPYISVEAASSLGVELVEFEELLRNSDFITIHTPLTDETRNLIDKEAIASMKEGVRIINCARGGIIDEVALYNALKTRKVTGAALDVFEKEPLTESPLLELDNFISTPHLGAATEEAQENVAIAIAHQIVDYLTQGIIRNAVNAPSVEPELLKKLRPYLILAEKLGRFESQVSDGRMEEIRIGYRGEIAGFDCAPLTVSVVKGVLEPILEAEVNPVNALPLAKARGIRIVESKSTIEEDYASLITVGIKTDKGFSEVAGTLFSRQDPRIVRIDEFHLEALPEGYLLVFSNLDVPGVIGQIGTLLGQNNVNIAGMQLGREKPGGRAVAVVNVDTPIPPKVMEEVRQLPNIFYAKLVKV